MYFWTHWLLKKSTTSKNAKRIYPSYRHLVEGRVLWTDTMTILCGAWLLWIVCICTCTPVILVSSYVFSVLEDSLTVYIYISSIFAQGKIQFGCQNSTLARYFRTEGFISMCTGGVKITLIGVSWQNIAINLFRTLVFEWISPSNNTQIILYISTNVK